MGNGLFKKIGMGVVLPLAFVLNSCVVKTYEIDGNEVKYKFDDISIIPFWILKEKTKSGKINRYFFEKNKRESPFSDFKTGNQWYSIEDSLVFQKAKAKATYLFERIDFIEDSIKQAEDLRIMQEKQARIDYGLKALE